MLICTRCNTTRSGNSVTHKRCDCGGQYAVIRDKGTNTDFEADGPKELVFGDDKKHPRATGSFLRNRKAFRSTERLTEEGVGYGESDLLEM